MNAFQPSRLPQQPPVNNRRSVPRKRRREQRNPYEGVTVEVTTKLVINVLLSGAAIASLGQLLSYHLSQQTKLQELQTEVKQTEKRVDRLRSDFSNYFDPQQAKTIMQEQGYKVDPNQRQIFWLDKGVSEEETAPSKP